MPEPSAPEQAYALWRAVDARLPARPDPRWLDEEADRLRTLLERVERAPVGRGITVAVDFDAMTCEIDATRAVLYAVPARIFEQSDTVSPLPLTARSVESKLAQAAKLASIDVESDGQEFSARLAILSSKPRAPRAAAAAAAAPHTRSAAPRRAHTVDRVPMKASASASASRSHSRSLADKLLGFYRSRGGGGGGGNAQTDYVAEYGQEAFMLFNLG